MLIIRQEQIDELARHHFFNKLHCFLVERCRHESMQAQLRDPGKWDILWRKFWEGVKSSEKMAAITLTFVLVCQCEGLPPEEMLPQAMQQADPEFFMQSFWSDHGYLRSSEFSRSTLHNR